MRKVALMAGISCLAMSGCGGDSDASVNSGSAVMARPVCQPGYIRRGNKCVPNTPTPPPTQTCPDGTVILTTQQCPVPPPPPPPTQTCADGTVIPTTQPCPEPPPPTQTCADGTVIPSTQPCPLPPPPPPATQTCWDGSVIPTAETCPVKPTPVQCPDGTTVPQGQTCPVAPPPPTTVTWLPVPLKNGGYARIIKVEPGPFSELNVLPHDPAVVGSVWYVVPAAWGAVDGNQVGILNPNNTVTIIKTPTRFVQALAPMDKIDLPFAGFYVYLDDIEGVAPAIPAGGGGAAMPMLATAAQGLTIVNTDDSYQATGVKRCMGLSLNSDGSFSPTERSSVEIGGHYRVSVREAGVVNKYSPVLLVSATPTGSSEGRAIVPHYCLTPRS